MLGGSDEALTCMGLEGKIMFSPFCLSISDLDMKGLRSKRWGQMVNCHKATD